MLSLNVKYYLKIRAKWVIGLRVKSNKLYIDYLDHTVSGSTNFNDLVSQLRFDLLLFSEEILCMSVPACVKLDSTTEVLMRLTPFWKNGKIKLILDNKHQNNPWNYFANRKRKLEKEFLEEDLLDHFEYKAYISSHTDYFYDVYIKNIVNIQGADLYLDKKYDTDYCFRESIKTQIYENSETIFKILPVKDGIHIGKVFEDLLAFSDDKKAFFQRTAIQRMLSDESNATEEELQIICKMLDKGFAYANGISSFAAPISLITNRLTGKYFIKIIKSADNELFQMIQCMSWSALYRLSINDVWVDFIDHLNKLLVLYQGSRKYRDSLYNPAYLEKCFSCHKFINKLYESAMEALQFELLKVGATIVDVINIKEYSDNFIEKYLFHKKEYLDIIRRLDELFPAIKITIRSLDRKYKDSSLLLRDQGYLVSLDNEF